jgi:methionyl-tRNA formyltransferase
LFVWSAKPVAAPERRAPGEIHVDDGAVVVACGDGALRLERVALEGEPESTAIEWIRGAGRQSGKRLGRMEP